MSAKLKSAQCRGCGWNQRENRSDRKLQQASPGLKLCTFMNVWRPPCSPSVNLPIKFCLDHQNSSWNHCLITEQLNPVTLKTNFYSIKKREEGGRGRKNDFISLFISPWKKSMYLSILIFLSVMLQIAFKSSQLFQLSFWAFRLRNPK